MYKIYDKTISSIIVISVIIKLQHRVVFRLIFSLYMKVSSIHVISVIIELHNRVVFRDIFNQHMKVSSILVISVIIKLQREVIFRNIFSVSTNSINYLITFWSPLYNYIIIALYHCNSL